MPREIRNIPSDLLSVFVDDAQVRCCAAIRSATSLLPLLNSSHIEAINLSERLAGQFQTFSDGTHVYRVVNNVALASALIEVRLRLSKAALEARKVFLVHFLFLGFFSVFAVPLTACFWPLVRFACLPLLMTVNSMTGLSISV